LADVDGDGRLDLLTGSDNCCDNEPGFFWFGRDVDGRFIARPKVRVRVGDDFPGFMSRFMVALADWEGNGRLDIVAALSHTRPGLYHSHGVWSPAEPVGATRPVEGSPDWVGSQPCCIDWDGDGRLDLVYEADRYPADGTAAFSEVVWHRNIGAAGVPRLSEPCRLTLLPALETATGLSVGDWDSDCWPDLVVGYVRGSVEGGSYRCVAAGIRVYPRRLAIPREPARVDEKGAKRGL
jgi:FG-GAP-like repeat